MNKFMVIWIGEMISTIGSGMSAFALSIYTFKQTGSVTLVALVTLLAFAPTVLLSPIGGLLADRWDRRVMMMLGEGLSAIGLAMVLLATSMRDTSWILFYIGIFVSSFFLSVLEPAYKASISDLVTKEDYAKASGMIQIAGASKFLIAPLIAGFLLKHVGLTTILLIDMGTIIVTLLTISIVRNTIKAPNKEQTFKSFQEEFIEGIRFLGKQKEIRKLVLLMTGMCFFIAFLQTLMIPMAMHITSVEKIGMLESFSAIGMLIGSILISAITVKNKYAGLKISLAASGVCMLFVGVFTNYYLLFIACLMFFTTLPFVNTLADVLIRVRIPNELQGRIWGLIGLISQIGYLIAYAISGVLADQIFEPMFMGQSILSETVGKIIGTGAGRGIGFMLIVAGILMAMIALIYRQSQGELDQMVES